MRVLSLILLFVLVGCAERQPKYRDRPMRDIYVSALEKMKKSEFTEAGDEFLEVDRQYPYSSWAAKAMLMSSYCYYRARKFDDAIRNLEIFTKFNAKHQYIDYAYYLNGMCHMAQVNSSKKDIEKAEDAVSAFRRLLRAFPTSKYAAGARKQLMYLNNVMAAHDMEIGRFYAKQRNFRAALGHFSDVIRYHFNTAQMPEAYYRTVESLIALGLIQEAADTFKTMPKVEEYWYNSSKSLLDRFAKTPRYKLIPLMATAKNK